jgi:hypothetical protein
VETDIPMATAASDSNSTEEPIPPLENDVIRREGRAQTQEMDVALLRQGGIYEVRSASGGVYEVDVLQRTCTCLDESPEGGCKHYRRVRTDIQAGLVPRPDGKLPAAAQPTLTDEEVHAIRSAEATIVKQYLLDALLTRELERTQLDQEIHDLKFLVEILLEVGVSEGYGLDESRTPLPDTSRFMSNR